MLTSLIKSSVNVINDALLKTLGIINDFTSYILPRRVSPLHFHIFVVFLIDFKIASKFAFILYGTL